MQVWVVCSCGSGLRDMNGGVQDAILTSLYDPKKANASQGVHSLQIEVCGICSNFEDAPLLDCKSVNSLARADVSCTLSTWRGLPLYPAKLGETARRIAVTTPRTEMLWCELGSSESTTS